MDRKTWAQEFAKKTEGLTLPEFLRASEAEFGSQLCFATSLGAEDQAVFHQLLDLRQITVFTLDTGRLPNETYDVLAETVARYGRRIEVLFPAASKVQALVARHGINLFYESVANRKACCGVRKVNPLNAKLGGYTAWITGLRREQSPTRGQLNRVEYDEAHDMVKLNPLADWTRDEVWDYLGAHNVPVNALHAQGYPSLGCAPCTRAIADGEEERAGRWWWELPEHKECGIHVGPAPGKKFSFQGLKG